MPAFSSIMVWRLRNPAIPRPGGEQSDPRIASFAGPVAIDQTG